VTLCREGFLLLKILYRGNERLIGWIWPKYIIFMNGDMRRKKNSLYNSYSLIKVNECVSHSLFISPLKPSLCFDLLESFSVLWHPYFHCNTLPFLNKCHYSLEKLSVIESQGSIFEFALNKNWDR
jgi:hypothetical protein